MNLPTCLSTYRRAYLVLFSACMLWLGLTLPAQAATLYFSPNTGVYPAGTHFSVSVMVSTNQSMNGVDATVQFPTNKIEVISVSKQGSIFNLWVQEPSFSNLGPVGTVHFQGVKLNPGFIGTDGKVLDIIFRVKDPGLADVTYANGAVLANDGRGTNIISSFGSGIFTLRDSVPTNGGVPVRAPGSVPARPLVRQYGLDTDGKDALFATSDAPPKWSNSAYAKLAWDVPDDVTGVSMVLDTAPDTDPGPKSDGLTDNKVFPLLNEGKQYFHIRFINAAGPGPILHYPLFTDFHPPKYFSIEFPNTEINYYGIYTTSNPRPFVDFFTTDDLSGIDHYEYKAGDHEWARADSIVEKGFYRLPKLVASEKQSLTVRAIDLAGNFTDATAQLFVEPIAPPVITYMPDHITFPREDLVVEGTATPYAQVDVVLQNDVPKTETVRADGEGVWRIVESGIRTSGTYTVVARQRIGNDAESHYTSPMSFYASSGVWSWWRALDLGRYVPAVEHVFVLLVLVQMWRVYRARRMMGGVVMADVPKRKVRNVFSHPEQYLLTPPPTVVLAAPEKKKRRKSSTKRKPPVSTYEA